MHSLMLTPYGIYIIEMHLLQVGSYPYATTQAMRWRAVGEYFAGTFFLPPPSCSYTIGAPTDWLASSQCNWNDGVSCDCDSCGWLDQDCYDRSLPVCRFNFCCFLTYQITGCSDGQICVTGGECYSYQQFLFTL